MTRETGGSNCYYRTGQLANISWCIWSSIFLFLGHPLRGLHMELTNIFTFLPVRDAKYILFPKYFCHQFFNHVPLKSLIFQPFHGPQPIYQWTITFLPFLLQSKVANKCITLRRFPSAKSFRDVPKWGCGAQMSASFLQNHLQTICKSSVSSALLTDLSYCLWSHNCKLAGRRWCSRVEIMGIWATLHVTYSYFQGLFMFCYIYTTSIWGWNVAVHMQLYDLVDLDNASSWWEDQVIWKP